MVSWTIPYPPGDAPSTSRPRWRVCRHCYSSSAFPSSTSPTSAPTRLSRSSRTAARSRVASGPPVPAERTRGPYTQNSAIESLARIWRLAGNSALVDVVGRRVHFGARNEANRSSLRPATRHRRRFRPPSSAPWASPTGSSASPSGSTTTSRRRSAASTGASRAAISRRRYGERGCSTRSGRRPYQSRVAVVNRAKLRRQPQRAGRRRGALQLARDLLR